MADMRLDQLFPRWDYRERHHIRLAAESPDAVITAVETATWGDFPMFRTIFVVTSLGRRRPAGDSRVFEDFLGTGPALARTGDEVVYGWIVRLGRSGGGSPLVDAPPDAFAGFDQRHTIKIGFNFHYVEGLLTTETRVSTADARTRRLFWPYWLLVRLLGSPIRHEWLRGIRRRAMRPAR